MAILKAPLFSFAASGKLADSLVYMKWKGLNDVRKYVIPTNPKTPAQTTQRITNFKAGVTKWHTFSLTALDLAAWSLLASTCISKTRKSVVGCLSNFNAFLRYFVDGIVANAATVWNEISNVNLVSKSSTNLWFMSTLCTDADLLKLYWGTTKTYMPNAVNPDAGHTDNHNAFNITGLKPSTKYFFYIKATLANRDARTGIYSDITLAA